MLLFSLSLGLAVPTRNALLVSVTQLQVVTDQTFSEVDPQLPGIWAGKTQSTEAPHASLYLHVASQHGSFREPDFSHDN